jgi:hypothetical protein
VDVHCEALTGSVSQLSAQGTVYGLPPFQFLECELGLGVTHVFEYPKKQLIGEAHDGNIWRAIAYKPRVTSSIRRLTSPLSRFGRFLVLFVCSFQA